MTFIGEQSGRFAVALLLRVWRSASRPITRGASRAEQPYDRDVVDRGLLSNIHEIWAASGRSYGADRVHQQLRREGIRVGRKRVERLMRQQGWQGAHLRRGWRGGSTRQLHGRRAMIKKLHEFGRASPSPPCGLTPCGLAASTRYSF
jgi:putative transposase